VDGDVREALEVVAAVDASRQRLRVPAADRRRRLVELIVGGGFLVALTVWLLLDPPVDVSPAVLLACLAAATLALAVEFEIGPGSAVPSSPVIFVALFLLPGNLVPVVVLGGFVVVAAAGRVRDPERVESLGALASSAWHAVGPALVFSVTGLGAAPPGFADLPLLAVAVLAMFAFDAAASAAMNCVGLGVPARTLAGALRFTMLVDLLLVPVGLTAAAAAPGSSAALLLLVPPILLLALLQRDRRAHIDHSIVLSGALSEVAARAHRDPLTGIGNRLAWEEALDVVRASDRSVGIVLLDVDGLKAANDTLGHQIGDRLISAVADVVAAVALSAREATAARLGGDEFGLLVPGVTAERVEVLAIAVRDALAATPALDGLVQVRASVGVAHRGAGAAVDEALAAADLAVYAEKARRRQGRSGDGFQGRLGALGPVRNSDPCASSAASAPSWS
jgi:diguanylate cyclase (GGDEF)-like protein